MEKDKKENLNNIVSSNIKWREINMISTGIW